MFILYYTPSQREFMWDINESAFGWLVGVSYVAKLGDQTSSITFDGELQWNLVGMISIKCSCVRDFISCGLCL